MRIGRITLGLAILAGSLIPAASLLADTDVRVRTPSLWEEHPLLIVMASAIILFQAVLIGVLLIQRAQRRRAEMESSGLRIKEERIHEALDRAPVVLWTTRTDSTLDYINSTATDFTGLPNEKLLGNGWLDVVHPEDLERMANIYQPAFEAQTPFQMEYRFFSPAGEYRWVLDSAVPRYEPDGTFAGYIGSTLDITERKEAEDRMLESRIALELSHQDIQQLAGRLITAHEDERRHLARELHDDLTQRLARMAIDAGKLEHGAGSQAAATEMRKDLVRLSEDVHALSYRLHPSVLDDLGLVEALRAECDRVARHCELRVDIEASGVPAALPADASLCLFRVAQEALNNVARHARASAVTVELSPSSKGLRLAVSDNGGGFDFSRSRERASLGLASMRERVSLLHGHLDIESALGGGTTVVAWVPA